MSTNTGNSSRTAGLRPFVKGQSGNPAGRPKKAVDVSSLALDSSDKAMRKLAKLVDSDDDRVALQAAIAVLDRAVGKPKQTTEVKADVTNHGSEPVSDTAHWIAETLRARADRKAEESLPN